MKVNLCRICNAEFVRKRKSRRLTCSRLCLGQLIRSLKQSFVHRACVVCGVQMRLTAQQALDDKKTCSDVCRREQISRMKGGLGEGCCEMCGRSYKISRFHLRAGRRFCGDVCRMKWFRAHSRTTQRGEKNPYWRGGHEPDYYGPTWREARRQAWERTAESCEACGATRQQLGYRPPVHHKIPFRLFGVKRHAEANRQDNLQVLCKSCHMKAEWALGTANRKGAAA